MASSGVHRTGTTRKKPRTDRRPDFTSRTLRIETPKQTGLHGSALDEFLQGGGGHLPQEAITPSPTDSALSSPTSSTAPVFGSGSGKPYNDPSFSAIEVKDLNKATQDQTADCKGMSKTQLEGTKKELEKNIAFGEAFSYTREEFMGVECDKRKLKVVDQALMDLPAEDTHQQSAPPAGFRLTTNELNGILSYRTQRKEDIKDMPKDELEHLRDKAQEVIDRRGQPKEGYSVLNTPTRDHLLEAEYAKASLKVINETLAQLPPEEKKPTPSNLLKTISLTGNEQKVVDLEVANQKRFCDTKPKELEAVKEKLTQSIAVIDRDIQQNGGVSRDKLVQKESMQQRLHVIDTALLKNFTPTADEKKQIDAFKSKETERFQDKSPKDLLQAKKEAQTEIVAKDTWMKTTEPTRDDLLVKECLNKTLEAVTEVYAKKTTLVLSDEDKKLMEGFKKQDDKEHATLSKPQLQDRQKIQSDLIKEQEKNIHDTVNPERGDLFNLAIAKQTLASIDNALSTITTKEQTKERDEIGQKIPQLQQEIKDLRKELQTVHLSTHPSAAKKKLTDAINTKSTELEGLEKRLDTLNEALKPKKTENIKDDDAKLLHIGGTDIFDKSGQFTVSDDFKKKMDERTASQKKHSLTTDPSTVQGEVSGLKNLIAHAPISNQYEFENVEKMKATLKGHEEALAELNKPADTKPVATTQTTPTAEKPEIDMDKTINYAIALLKGLGYGAKSESTPDTTQTPVSNASVQTPAPAVSTHQATVPTQTQTPHDFNTNLNNISQMLLKSGVNGEQAQAALFMASMLAIMQQAMQTMFQQTQANNPQHTVQQPATNNATPAPQQTAGGQIAQQQSNVVQSSAPATTPTAPVASHQDATPPATPNAHNPFPANLFSGISGNQQPKEITVSLKY